jgi:hypothetical protein
MCDLLGFDHPVDHDAASDRIAITLCHNASHGCCVGHCECQRPGQVCRLDSFRVGVGIKIADPRDSSRRSEDFVRQVFGIEGRGVNDLAVGIHGTLLGAENAVQSRHGYSAGTDHQGNEQRNPHPAKNFRNRESLRSSTRWSRRDRGFRSGRLKGNSADGRLVEGVEGSGAHCGEFGPGLRNATVAHTGFDHRTQPSTVGRRQKPSSTD